MSPDIAAGAYSTIAAAVHGVRGRRNSCGSVFAGYPDSPAWSRATQGKSRHSAASPPLPFYAEKRTPRGPSWECVPMSASRTNLRYEAAQIVEAIDRARGDGRYFLVVALLNLPTDQRENALVQVLEKQLRADERQLALAELARFRPTAYLAPLIETGLRSRSIGVQQMTLARLPDLVGEGMATALCAQVEGWLRRRLGSSRRGGTWAMWEIPSAALALLPSYGTDRIVALLTDLEPKMQPDERDMWMSLKQTVNDSGALEQGLTEWMGLTGQPTEEPDPRDPTADITVDRAMKRLGYSPANPESPVHNSLADFALPTFVFDVGGEGRSGEEH